MEFWDWFPFVLYIGVALIIFLSLKLTRHAWVSSMIISLATGAIMLFAFRQFNVDPSCIKTSGIDTLESTLLAFPFAAVLIDYARIAFSRNPQRKVCGCCRREDDIEEIIYPDTDRDGQYKDTLLPASSSL